MNQEGVTSPEGLSAKCCVELYQDRVGGEAFVPTAPRSEGSLSTPLIDVESDTRRITSASLNTDSVCNTDLDFFEVG